MAELLPVESSMIQAVGYDAKTRTLEILFNSGRLYRYEGVPPEVYEELMASGSKGGYMRSQIIDMYPDFPISRRRQRQRQTPPPGGSSMSDDSVGRFPIPDLNELPEDIRNRILAVQEKSGFIPNVFLALAHRPDEFRAFFAYHDALMEKQGGLTKGEREMIVVATSGLNQCLYCVVAHGAILRIREKNPLIADQIATNYRKADITARQKAMLDFAAKVSLQAYKINDTDIEALHAHGFSDEDIWDIGAITAFFSLSNRMAHLTNMRPNDEFYLLGRVAPPQRVTKKRAKAETTPNRTKNRR